MSEEVTRYDRIILLALSQIKGLGPKLLKKLLEVYQKPTYILEASEKELCRFPRLTPNIAQAMLNIDMDNIDEMVTVWEDSGIELMTIIDGFYPVNLKKIANPPVILYQRGKYLESDEAAVAVVGSRACSEEGKAVASRLASGLAKHGFTVISGLAEGIDTAAHKGALEANGRTIGVLGSGVNIVHPYSNRELAEEIINSGALLSELHPNTPPAGMALMARDRIISGLSIGTIIVEAAAKSGTMDTAKHTLKQGRLLIVVDNACQGNRRLLKGGNVAIKDTTGKSIEEIAEKLRSYEIEEPEGESQMGLF